MQRIINCIIHELHLLAFQEYGSILLISSNQLQNISILKTLLFLFLEHRVTKICELIFAMCQAEYKVLGMYFKI